jgi:hypothetical protein
VWDVLKIEIRDHTIMYCKNKSRLNRQEQRSLEKELNAKLAKRDGLILHDSTSIRKSIPMNIISILLA